MTWNAGFVQATRTRCGCGRRVLHLHAAPHRTICVGCGRECQVQHIPQGEKGCTCPPHRALNAITDT